MKRGVLLPGLLLWATAAWSQPDLQERLKHIQADPVALKSAVEAGKKNSFFCANCHGESGISKELAVPNLAGQNPAYLLEQIRKFGSGERKDPFMQGLLKMLKDEERLQIVAYFSSQPVQPSRSDGVLAKRGKELFGRHCVRCHGEQARGNELTPRLAGQKQPYLEHSILNYRDGTGIRNNQQMSIATAVLKNEDVTAITHYLTQLP